MNLPPLILTTKVCFAAHSRVQAMLGAETLSLHNNASQPVLETGSSSHSTVVSRDLSLNAMNAMKLYGTVKVL